MIPQTITQRGIIATVHDDSETAVCPFCHQTITRTWQHSGLVGDGDEQVWQPGQWAGPDEWCPHFCGFVSAGGYQVAANFTGPASMLPSENEPGH